MTRITKDILVVLVLVLIMIGALVVYSGMKQKGASTGPATATTTSKTTGPLVTGTPLDVTESGQYYEADLQYPSQTPLVQTASTAADAAAVAIMKAYDQSAIAQFKQDIDVASITPQIAEDQGLSKYNKYQITSSYQMYSSAATVSYIFTVNENTLGAHPNSYFHTFTFDQKSGALLNLSDLFVPNADYLDKLSSLSRTTLTSQLGSSADASFINPGTTASSTNFANFILQGANLVIYFAPYQVAPYSAGPQIVYLPLSQFGSLLKQEYQ